MEVSYRFASPFVEENDFDGCEKLFENGFEEIKKVISNAPYEISIIFSLLSKELKRMGD